jgi:hypothetical protein
MVFTRLQTAIDSDRAAVVRCDSCRRKASELKNQEEHDQTDPPFTPLPDSYMWYEPVPMESSTTAKRHISLSESESRQTHSAPKSMPQSPPGRQRARSSCETCIAAALTNEATRLAGSALKKLAAAAGAPPELLTKVSQICAGKHSSAALSSMPATESAFTGTINRVRSFALSL